MKILSKFVAPDVLMLAKNALETSPEISDDLREKLRKENLADLAAPDHYELFQNYPI